jgi:uncharacterized protein (DUF1778 family)
MGAADKDLGREAVDTLLDALTRTGGAPERVNYAAGVLLDDQDFRAEQDYLRGRTARVLGALHGYGTVCGLRVTRATGDAQRRAGRIEVAPGLALDRYGRLIEVRRPQCIDTSPWLAQQATAAPEVWQRILDAANAGRTQLQLAVQVRFAVCKHGLTPAFAAGPYSATDYVVPARLADAFEIVLVPRPQAAPPASDAPFQAFAQLLANPPATADALRDALAEIAMNAWRPPRDSADDGDAMPWVLLAHVTLPTKPRQVSGHDYLELDADALAAAADDTGLVANGVRPLAFNPWRWQSTPLT